MSGVAILTELRTRGIRLWVDGGRLRCSAPRGAMTPELEHALTSHKSELLGLLKTAGSDESDAIKPVARAAHMPLSFAQERFWFLTRLHPGSSYNIAAYWEIFDAVDTEMLGRAVAALVARHEILRTSFSEHAGVPVASIAPSVVTPFDVVDVADDAIAAVERLAQQPLDLSCAPLLRTFLLREVGAPSVFVLVVHHIISDAWSVGMLLHELALVYDSLARGAKLSWPELPTQYADYTAWQREQVNSGDLASELDFWEQKLKGCPTLLALPGARPAAAPPTKSAVHTFSLGSSVSEHIRALCTSERATLYMVLLSIYNALLFRYTNQKSILIGVPVANRVRPELENVIGLFVNALVIRTELDGKLTARWLVRQARESVLELHAHSEIPFEKIVERVRPERTTASNPLVQVALVVNNTPHSSEYRTVTGGAMFDLTLYAWENQDGEIGCQFEYRAELFARATIERMSGHFKNLAAAFASDPDQSIGRMRLLGEAERDELLAAAARPPEEYPSDCCVHELIRKQCHRTPGRVAVACGTELTYAELDEASDRLAAKLERSGVRPGVAVGICVDRSERMPVAFLGVLKAGGAYVPLDPQFPQQRRGEILLDSGAAVLITERSLADRVPTAGLVPVWLDDEMPPGRPANAASPDDLAYIIYTSGSTGKPKGVEIPHRALVNFLCSMQREPGIHADDRLMAVTTLCFDIAALEMYLPLLVGARVEIAPRGTEIDGIALRRLIDESAATMMQATPATWRILIESGWTGRAGLKILCGGEVLSRDLADQLIERGSEVWNLYGPTETTVWSTVARVTAGTQTLPLGAPVANTSLYVMNPDGQLVPRGVTGELYIGGDGLARGYHNRPELTQERFVSHPFCPGERLYRTGDLARYRDDGDLEFLGRADDQIKIRGFRVEPGEIERVLEHQPGVRQAVVVAHSDQTDVRLVAYVAVPREHELRVEDLRTALGRTLPHYMVPSLIMRLDELPLTPNGKLDRNALPEPDFRAASMATRVRPQTAVEAELLRIWEDSLGLSDIGITDDFFDIGGTSLMAVRMFSRIEERFGPIPVSVLFEAPTVQQFAQRLESSSSWSGWRCLVPIQPNGTQRPLFVVPGFDGNALILSPLTRSLGPDQPVYGLQFVGLDGATPPLERIEEIAAHFLAEVRTVQPRGPYYLAGFCLGGVVAYEMAQQLTAMGMEVRVLALLGTWPPHRRPAREHLIPREPVLRWQARSALREILELDVRHWPAFLFRKARRLAERVFSREYEFDKVGYFRVQVATANWTAFERYKLKPYDGTVLSIAATGRPLVGMTDPRLTWKTMARGGCTIQQVPATGAVELLRPPHVGHVVEHLKDALASSHAAAARP
jgi:amino acid adenylation domain-containing protein